MGEHRSTRPTFSETMNCKLEALSTTPRPRALQYSCMERNKRRIKTEDMIDMIKESSFNSCKVEKRSDYCICLCCVYTREYCSKCRMLLPKETII